jgi:hypothetical protein
MSGLPTTAYAKPNSVVPISDALSDQEHRSCFSFINKAGVCDDNPIRADWQYARTVELIEVPKSGLLGFPTTPREAVTWRLRR